MPFVRSAMLLCIASLALSASAQTPGLSGRITDAETGAPLPGATVSVPPLGLGAAADADGRYRLSLPDGPVRVVVQFLGYRSDVRQLTVAGPTALDVALAPSIVEAPDVVVTARARAADVLSTPQSVAVVGPEMLDRAGGATPLDALDEVAGVRLLRTGPGIAKPVIRGLTAQRVLVVADGVRQEGQGWGDEHGPEIGAADVDRIEVVRGPLSLLYGSDALGGVVQTTPADLFAPGQPVRGEVRLGGETAAQQSDVTAVVGGVSGRLGYEVRGGALRAGLVRTPAGLVPGTALDTETLAARVGTRLGARGRLTAEAGAFRQALALFEDEPLLDDSADRFTVATPRQSVAHDRAVAHLDLPLGRERLDVIAALQQNRRREFEEAGDPELFLRLTTATLDARLHHRPLGPVFGTVGLSLFRQRNETLAEEALIPGGTTLNGAVYVADQLVAGPLTVDAGLRLDLRRLDVEDNADLGVTAQTRRYSALTGALGAAYQIRPELSVSANLGRAFRAPILQELFGNGVHEGTLRFERGDAGLAPETSLALDGVVRYLTPHVYAEASGFANAVDGYIVPRATGETDPESGFQVYRFRASQALLTGVEARVDVHPHALHGLGLHVAGDLTRGTDRDADAPLPFVPPARLQIALEYQADRLGPARDLEARFGPTVAAAQRRPDLPDEVPVDGYTVWAGSVSASFPLRGVTLTPTLSVDNATDATYVDALSRYRAFGVPAAGRSVRLALRASF